MNKIFVIFITFIVSCSSQRDSDLDVMDILGNVTSVRENTYNINDSTIIKKKFKFDSLGYLTTVEYKTINIIKRDTIVSKQIITYTSDNNIKEIKHYRNNRLKVSQEYSNIDYLFDSIVHYDEENNIVGFGSLKYNNDKRVLESNLYDIDSHITDQEFYIYDKNSNQIEVEHIGQINYEKHNFYDTSNRLIKSITYQLDSSITEHFKYTNDSLGNWVLRKCYNSNGILVDSTERTIDYK